MPLPGRPHPPEPRAFFPAKAGTKQTILKARPKPSGPNGIIERKPIKVAHLGPHPDQEGFAITSGAAFYSER
jgi:hypothetical protein